jgi:Ca2+-transporting ATPase
MTVQEIVLAGSAYAISQGQLDPHFIRKNPALARAVEIMALCNNAMVVDSYGQQVLSGDPTETALLSAVGSCGGNGRKLRAEHRLVAEVPFDSDRKMMSAVRLYGAKRLALVKGAPEKIIPRCSGVLRLSGEARLGSEERRKILSDSHSLGAEGMRVLALAYRPIGKMAKYTSANTERGLVYVGMVSMEDPPRPEVPDAIALCRSAGIKVVMVTGDSLATAKAIAKKVGLMGDGMLAVDGAVLEEMANSELERILPTVALFARVTPEQKYRIVSSFMRRGEVVAVTGDGVNDAPAIKKADIGVAMGISGTDVTKEVSDIVLTDDNFTSIVSAVKYGRTIFNNIKSFVRYQISTNVAALSLMFAAPALSLPLPLLPIQLLWINIMIDGPPALALGAEPPSHEEMKKPPRNPKASFLSRNLALSMLLLGLLMSSITLAVFGFYLSYAPAKAYTAVFTLFVFLQLANALNCRSAQDSLFTRPLSNPYLFIAIIISLALHMAIVFYAPLEEIFKTVPLAAEDFAVIICASALILVFEELKKKFFKHTTFY